MSEQSLTDQQQVYVTLSSKGSAIFEQLSAIYKEELRRMLLQLRQLIERLSTGGNFDQNSLIKECLI